MESERPFCRVCGLPCEDAEQTVLFGAAGKPLFYAHKQGCAAVVRAGRGVIADAALNLLHKKAPGLMGLMKGAIARIEDLNAR